MRKTSYIFGLAIYIAMGASSARAQQQTQDQPIPAYHSPLASQADNPDPNAPVPQLLPDNHALTGAQDPTLGVPSTNHSYWTPHVDVAVTLDSEPPVSGGGGGWTTWTTLTGGVDLRWLSGRSDMKVNYVGGGVFSNDGASSNGIVQDLNFVDRFNFRRWALTVIEQAAYTPETAFGSGGFPGISVPGGAPGLGGLIPGQTIITSEGQRFFNTSLGEVDVFLTPRSSLTFSGGYSLLHSFGQDLLDYGDVIAQAGYNYQATRKDSVGISYVFSGFRYNDFDESINTNTLLLSYGRNITGRLAFRIGAGPEFASINVPIIPGTGVGTIGPTSGGSTSNLYWFLSTSVQYQLQRTALAATYSHGVAGGSGVFGGSLADTVTGSASRQLSRISNGTWILGYSRNSGLTVNGLPQIPNSNQTFDYWFTGLNYTRSWGRSLNLNVGYQLQYQNSNSSFCVGAGCGSSFTRNLITFGVGWRKQPIPIE
ncbi:MAG TPA: hypothetical protein VN861_12520 [Candidatus Acidoferrales bacterium]|jgi:hypothetical protein|nr:hypothetical protein [Candidatus Acidoferrales bacterium]